MKASLVSAACEAVDAMNIATANVAETTKDLARPTVMHMDTPSLTAQGGQRLLP